MSGPGFPPKRVRFGDPNFKETVLKWYGGAEGDLSEVESDCDKNFVMDNGEPAAVTVSDISDDEAPNEIDDQDNLNANFKDNLNAIWNKLPLEIRRIPDLRTFRRALKTFLFQQAGLA